MTEKKKAKLKDKKSASFNSLLEQAELMDRESHEEAISNALRFGVINFDPEAELGERLEVKRKAKGLTQGKLAELTKRADREGKGLSRSVISLYELGTNRPGPKELRLLCESLRVSPSYLIYGKDDPFDNNFELSRFGGRTQSAAEFYAALTYCFTHLHHHHKVAIMQLMMGLLRGWKNGFDADLDKSANDDFLKFADDLRLLLSERQKKSDN